MAFKKYGGDVPQKAEVIAGLVLEGRLGPVRPSQYGPSRKIVTDKGSFWVPNVAALEDVFGLPNGALVRLTYGGMAESKTGGKPYQNWEVEYDAEAGGPLPF